MTKQNQEAAEARRAIDGYEKILQRVREAQEMTSTPAWRQLYDWLRALAEAHGKAILSEEKTRAIIAHQEAIKTIRNLMERPRLVVDELNHYCSSMPLFATQFATRARWNEGLGIIETSEAGFVRPDKAKLPKADKDSAETQTQEGEQR